MPDAPITPEVHEAFWKNTQVADGCWPWIGTKMARDGRGYLRVKGKTCVAPRLSYAIHNGSYPAAGLFVCHSCDNPNCVNPGHLFAGTPRENAQDMVSKMRQVFGERHRSTRLSDADVAIIRASDRPELDIAAEFGVSAATVNRIKTGKSWRYATGPSVRRRNPKLPKTHCKLGHELTEANVYVNQGKRWCLTCKKEALRASRAKAP